MLPSEAVARCQICDWPLVERVEDGCTATSCSFRPKEGTPEHERVRRRREAVAAGLDALEEEKRDVVDALVEEGLRHVGEAENGVVYFFEHRDGRAVEVEYRRADRPSLLERWVGVQEEVARWNRLWNELREAVEADEREQPDLLAAEVRAVVLERLEAREALRDLVVALVKDDRPRRDAIERARGLLRAWGMGEVGW